MKLKHSLLLIIALPYITLAQIPKGNGAAIAPSLAVPVFVPYSEVAPAAQEEETEKPKHFGGPYIFGDEAIVDISIQNGNWRTEGDLAIWELKIEPQELTYSLNYQFDVFEIPQGGNFFIISDKQIQGPFNDQNQLKNGGFANFPLPGESHVLQLQVPKSSKDKAQLHLKRIIIGNKLPEGIAEDCYVNANCPSADNFRKAQRSAVMILSGGTGKCSGTLVNNTLQDKKPYILTAEHCLPNNPNAVQNWIVAFNYETPLCEDSIIPISQTVSVKRILAHNISSDFALLELTEQVPDSYNPYYAGWDRSDSASPSQVSFHHPNGMTKKISTNNDKAVPVKYLEGTTPPETWRVNGWEEGSTEGGSSGSGLFDPSQNLIGTLVGGRSSCNSPEEFDYYGRIAVGFIPSDENDSTVTLKPWLDPTWATIDTLGGLDPNDFPSNHVDIAISGYGFTPTLCDTLFNPSIKVTNVGDLNSDFEVKMWVDNNLVESKSSSNLTPNSTQEIVFSQQVLTKGEHDVAFEIITPTDDAFPFNNYSLIVVDARKDGESVLLNMTLDDFGSEISWVIEDSQGSVKKQQGPYADGKKEITFNHSFCLSPGCYVLKVTDSYGDGLCCDYGNGHYELYDQHGTEIASGWNLPPKELDPQTEVTNFCIEKTVGIKEYNKASFKVFPNPVLAGNALNITISTTLQAEQFIWVTAEGKSLQTQQFNNLIAPNTSGVYWLKSSESHSVIGPILVK